MDQKFSLPAGSGIVLEQVQLRPDERVPAHHPAHPVHLAAAGTEYLALFNPAYPLWVQIDWLLVGIFAFMSLMIMAGADLRHDAQVAFVGLVGGLVIESWGTQTSLWTYYTNERPPLWIIPAWPIASLAIDRMARLADRLLPAGQGKAYRRLYAACFGIFLLIMVRFIWPTFDKPLTWMALLLCLLLILVPYDRRLALLTFAAGAGLGYFLERWGTTRECWTYYTGQTPPLFAVLAHGMAAVAFWRARLLLVMVVVRLPKEAGLYPTRNRGAAARC